MFFRITKKLNVSCIPLLLSQDMSKEVNFLFFRHNIHFKRPDGRKHFDLISHVITFIVFDMNLHVVKCLLTVIKFYQVYIASGIIAS